MVSKVTSLLVHSWVFGNRQILPWSSPAISSRLLSSHQALLVVEPALRATFDDPIPRRSGFAVWMPPPLNTAITSVQ